MNKAASLDVNPLAVDRVANREATPATRGRPVAKSQNQHLNHNLFYRWRSVVSSIFVFGSFTLALLSPPLIHMGSLPERILTSCGWILFAVGIFIRIWATLYIGGHKSKRIISEGPYSICRNPLYWGTLTVLASQVCLYHSLTFALGAVVPILIYIYGVIPAEENHLRYKLGDEYLAYYNAVPKMWPNFANYSSPPEINVNLKGLRAEVLRILGWIGLPLLAMVLNFLRETPHWPRLFNLP